MASQLDKVFTADPKSVHELFLYKGTVGFYIPAYQREYSWDDKNINRLIEDICSGISSFLEHDDAITFIGTIISIIDTDHTTINPFIHGELPSDVMSVIDGQQRLTTLTLLACCLYQRLSNLFHKFSNFPSHIKDWVHNEINPILHRLKLIMEIDRYASNPVYRFYPKITRAYLDQWSVNQDSAFYNSPIANYLFGFITFYHENADDKPKEEYKHIIGDKVMEGDIPKHKRITDNVAVINKRIDLITKNGGDDTFRFPSLINIFGNDKLQARMLGRILSTEWLEEIGGMNDRHQKLFDQTIRTLIFVKFYLDRVAVTNVVATNENYAFDMFEALNTTGEPLTAFETFKPKVIDAEAISNYERSASRQYIVKIDSVLDRYKKAEDKQAATTRLLKPFRLAYEGESLSKHLTDQRKFLNKSFDAITAIDDKRNFVKNLYEMSYFLESCWPAVKSEVPSGDCFKPHDVSEALLYLDMLREANHQIILGVLFRYFAKYINSAKDISDYEEFLGALKTICAFFVLWRSTRQGTDGIDSVYRDMLKSGYSKDGAIICGPISIKGCADTGNLPSLQCLQAGFRGYLDSKLTEPLNHILYTERAKNILTYKNNKSLTRFMLLIASDDVVPNKNNQGLVEKGVLGSCSLFNITSWREFRTIEHIYPQTATQGWPDSLTALASEHVIGNLLLLPQYINSSLGNRSWHAKQLIFRMLCAKTIDERNNFVKEANKQDIELSFATESIVINSKYMAHVEAVSNVDEWGNDFVHERSGNIYELVWARVGPWLGY